MQALEILKPRYSKLELKGFKNGFLIDDNTKLFAYTILSVKDEDFESLHNFHLQKEGYSYTELQEEETYNIYHGNGTYSSKDAKQLIEEGIFKYVSLRFFGILYQRDWYILYDCVYHEEDNTVGIISGIEELYDKEAFRTNFYFLPIPEFEERPDLGELIGFDLEHPITREDQLEKMRQALETLPPDKIPKRRLKQQASQREFIGQPWIVGYIKEELKERVNRAFNAFINESVFLPFIQKLKIDRPKDFTETVPLYHSEYYSLIYPHSKDYVICIVKASNNKNKTRLYYFVYVPSQKEMYEWTKPKLHPASGHYAEWVIEDIKDFSDWGDEYDLHNAAITMDDPNFWNIHVFKKEKGKYMYLEKMKY